MERLDLHRKLRVVVEVGGQMIQTAGYAPREDASLIIHGFSEALTPKIFHRFLHKEEEDRERRALEEEFQKRPDTARVFQEMQRL